LISHYYWKTSELDSSFVHITSGIIIMNCCHQTFTYI